MLRFGRAQGGVEEGQQMVCKLHVHDSPDTDLHTPCMLQLTDNQACCADTGMLLGSLCCWADLRHAAGQPIDVPCCLWDIMYASTSLIPHLQRRENGGAVLWPASLLLFRDRLGILSSRGAWCL